MEKLFWCIALPSFGQISNGRYIKGILLIALEFMIIIQANFNETIVYSFQGEIQTAIKQTKIMDG